jgi:polyhydroxyalkanoate synthase
VERVYFCRTTIVVEELFMSVPASARAQAVGPSRAVGAANAAERPAAIKAAEDLDHRLRERVAQALGGLSPWAAWRAWQDWGYHLATSPAREFELAAQAASAAAALGWFAVEQATGAEAPWPFEPEPSDRRFRDPAWRRPPFSLLAQAQLAAEAQWRSATADVRGAEEHDLQRVEFMGRFLLNAMAPANLPWTNPKVLQQARRQYGMNFVAGAKLLADDLLRMAAGKPLEGLDAFQVGRTMALTEGQVIFENALMELIQYAPATPSVHREPVLIIPAWIMKYYILDLTPEESLVRYLVGQGFTVFILSWKNPRSEARDTTLEDYRRNGVMAAVDAVSAVAPGEKIHAVGYCLGGTILSIAAAAMDRDGDHRLASLTLLAAQTDFVEAGELLLFVDRSQLAVLDDMMHARGYLDGSQMEAAFTALRPNEMLWAQVVERYMLAEPRTPAAMDAWLADATRMPAKMHTEYLRRLFIENEFSRGEYLVDGRGVAPEDIHMPIFALGAERDYIAPWRSVYKIVLYSSAPTTFVLSGGGHNSSVVSPPAKPGAYYRISTNAASDDYVDPDAWLAKTPTRPGSWWPAWVEWLTQRSSADQVAPPPMGRPEAGLAPLRPAPGAYVLET